MILIHQKNEILGPFLPSEVRTLLLFRRLTPDDLFAWPGAREWISSTTFKPFLELLKDDDLIMYSDRDLIVTRDRLLLKTQVFHKEQIDTFSVVVLESIRDSKGESTRTLLWIMAILFVWTLVIPVAIWYMNQKTPKEEGLGEIYGIRLTGSLGSEMIKDGMGLLPADDPKRGELEEVCEILKHWKAGDLTVPSSIPTAYTPHGSELVPLDQITNETNARTAQFLRELSPRKQGSRSSALADS